MEGKKRTTRGWVFLPVLVLAVTTCTDRPNVTSPEEEAGDRATVRDALVVEVTCVADVAALELSCELPNRVGTLIGPQFLIVGGQGTFVTLANTDPQYSPGNGNFTFDVTVTNLIPQALGTPDGSTVTGVKVFFHTDPHATDGAGAITIEDFDGEGIFTGSQQKYYAYNQIIETGQESASKGWRFVVPRTVNTFEFQVYVQADVQYLEGWVDVGNVPNYLYIGGSKTLTYAIKDVVGRTIPGTVTWSSPDITIATVGASSGTVTGVGGGVVDVVASSDVSAASGTGRVTVFDASQYDIELRYMTAATPGQLTAFENSRATWESLITGDLTDIDMRGAPASSCPAIDEYVDDVLIFVFFEAIDGPLGVLGEAGPCWIRTSSDPTPALPVAGLMRFDVADTAYLASGGQFEAVIRHEMAHVLGYGGMWSHSSIGLLAGTCTVDPYFTGTSAIAAFDNVGGGSYPGNKVPVENTGTLNDGTNCVHWRESVFDNELMTGIIDSGTNPLSEVTVKSFGDMGYTIASSGWETYALPGSAPALSGPGNRIQLFKDVMPGPVLEVPGDRRVEPPARQR